MKLLTQAFLFDFATCETDLLQATRDLIQSEYSYSFGSSPPLMTDSWLAEFYSQKALANRTDGIYDDMNLPDSLVSQLKQNSASTTPLWSLWSLPVRYVFGESVSRSSSGSCIRKVFAEAARRIENATCIKFELDTKARPDSIVVRTIPEMPCWSTLGYNASLNGINIGTGCMHVGQVTHLLLHALGLAHENLRPDGLNFQEVNLENAGSTHPILFGPWQGTNTSWEAAVSSLPFDFGSLTGLGPCYQSGSPGRACNQTLAPSPALGEAAGAQARAVMGNRDVLSGRDVQVLKKMYCHGGEEGAGGFVAPPGSLEPGQSAALAHCFLDDCDIAEVAVYEKAQSADVLPGPGGAFAESFNKTKLIYTLLAVVLGLILVSIGYSFWHSYRRPDVPESEEPLIVS